VQLLDHYNLCHLDVAKSPKTVCVGVVRVKRSDWLTSPRCVLYRTVTPKASSSSSSSAAAAAAAAAAAHIPSL
jgi:hypothetical protein